MRFDARIKRNKKGIDNVCLMPYIIGFQPFHNWTKTPITLKNGCGNPSLPCTILLFGTFLSRTFGNESISI